MSHPLLGFTPHQCSILLKLIAICERFEKRLGEGYVLDAAANSPLEVDREGDFYINAGIEENQEGFKESEGDREGDHLEVVDAWL